VHANDNLLAHKLFKQGQYAQAAEIFTDPAWKGVSLYRSEQWWRAAEAFVRANDAESHYNLGNCYVQLSYYELALEAYQRALALDPGHEDAQYNMELMLAVLEQKKNTDQESGLLQPKELENIESEDEKESDSGKASGGEKDHSSAGSDKKEKEKSGTESKEKTLEDAQQGKSGNSSEKSKQNAGNQGSSDVKGVNDQHQEQAQASGKSDSVQRTDDSQAAGLRNTLEAEQATEQWLNQIQHDPYRFLVKQIELEMQRRAASGQAPAEGGSQW